MRYAVVAAARRGQALREAMRQHDRQRHQVGCFVGGVAEHHSLVAGALFVGIAVDATRDVRRLAVDGRDHRAGAVVEAVVGVGVADPLDRAADDVRNVDVRRRGDLAGDHRHPGGHQRFARHAGVGVASQDRVENRIRDLVGNLVGVAFSH